MYLLDLEVVSADLAEHPLWKQLVRNVFVLAIRARNFVKGHLFPRHGSKEPLGFVVNRAAWRRVDPWLTIRAVD